MTKTGAGQRGVITRSAFTKLALNPISNFFPNMWKFLNQSEARKRPDFSWRHPSFFIIWEFHNQCDGRTSGWTGEHTDTAISIPSSNSVGADNYSPKLSFVVNFPYLNLIGGLANLDFIFQSCHPWNELICTRLCHFLVFSRDTLINCYGNFPKL